MKNSGRGRQNSTPATSKAGPSGLAFEDPRVSRFTYGGEDFMVFSAPVTRSTCEFLTKAERDILADVADGMSNGAIALKRGTSVHTVSNQIASLYRKTGVCTRAELALMAT
jgi:DNA-binding NarL/FixJ family response regulator